MIGYSRRKRDCRTKHTLLKQLANALKLDIDLTLGRDEMNTDECITALAEQHLTDYNGALPPLGIVRNATHALPRISRHQERSTLLPPACLLMYSC